MSSRNIFFFSTVQPHFFIQDSESKIFFLGKNHIKLNSLRGKLIKKNWQDQNGSPINQQKKEIKLWS